MPQIESFSCSNPDGSNKTIIKRGTTPGTWEIGTLAACSEAELHGVKGAILHGLGQPLGGGFYTKVYDSFAGPDVTFSPNVVEDPSDDSIQVGAAAAWSRDKALDFVAGVTAWIPAPPAPPAP